MRVLWVLIGLAAIGAAVAPSAEADETCASLTRTGLEAYQSMEFEAARQSLLAAALRECGTSERVVIHVTLARIAVTQDRQTEAVDEMKNALRLDPYVVLDPLTSPKVLAALNQAREEMSGELAAAPTRPPEVARTQTSAREKTGWAFMGAGGVSLLGAGTFFALATVEHRQQQDAADRDDRSERDEHWGRTSAYANAGYGALAVGLAAAGTGAFLIWGDTGDDPSETACGTAVTPWRDCDAGWSRFPIRVTRPAAVVSPTGLSVSLRF